MSQRVRIAVPHETIGEAARRVSPEIRQAHPDIPWTEIVGMRHKIGHDHMHVQDDILWSVVANDLPTLLAQLEKIVPAGGPE